jgi:hypothetical protein
MQEVSGGLSRCPERLELGRMTAFSDENPAITPGALNTTAHVFLIDEALSEGRWRTGRR